MENLKSYFIFTKSQQRGIIFLVSIIFTLLLVYFLVDFNSSENQLEDPELIMFEKELDSLRNIQIQNSKPKIYPFNPNYITDYKGYILGMSVEEIDRLLEFRKQDKWINSAKQFQQVTKVSDSLLNVISPYFKFPEWITKPNSKLTSNNAINYQKRVQKIDLNKATALQLQKVYGVGEKLSERIIRYRNGFNGGFIDDIQLLDIYGLTQEVIERITQEFTVKTPRQIQKLDLNSANVEELVTIQHIDYELAHDIVEQRTLREGFKTFEELIKVKDFPAHKIEIIKLYLSLK